MKSKQKGYMQLKEEEKNINTNGANLACDLTTLALAIVIAMMSIAHFAGWTT